jgi:hypothetical protein
MERWARSGKSAMRLKMMTYELAASSDVVSDGEVAHQY